MIVDTTNVDRCLKALYLEAPSSVVDHITAAVAAERQAWVTAWSVAATELVDYAEASAAGLAAVASQRRAEVDEARRDHRPMAAVADAG